MHLSEHLEALRYRMILALVGVLGAGVVMLVFGRRITAWLCVPLIEAQRAARVPTETYTLSPIAGFAVYLKVSMIAALVVASPWVVYQFWQFFAQGMYPSERRAVRLLAPFSAAMTALGVGFMYYLMLPVCLWFLISFTASFPLIDVGGPSPMFSALDKVYGSHPNTDASPTNPASPPSAVLPVLTGPPEAPVDGQVWFQLPQGQLKVQLEGHTRSVALRPASLVSPLIEIGQYINFVLVLGVGVVIAFQLPVGMLVAGWVGIINPSLIAGYRKYCVASCFGLGMLLTPPDVLSMMLLGFPLWCLFEFGLVLMRLAYRRRERASASG